MRICTSLQQSNFALPGFYAACKPIALSENFRHLVAAKEADRWPSRLALHEHPIGPSMKNGYHVSSRKLILSLQRKARNKNTNGLKNDDEADIDKDPKIESETESILSEVDQSSEKAASRDVKANSGEFGNSKAKSRTPGTNGRLWWKFWEGLPGRKERANDIGLFDIKTAESRIKSSQRSKESTATAAPQVSTETKEKQREGLGDQDGARWTWLLGSKKEDKKSGDSDDGDSSSSLARDYKDISIELREFLDPTPDNLLALILTALLSLSVLQIIWQLVLVTFAIIISAIKYSVLAAFLIGVIVFLL